MQKKDKFLLFIIALVLMLIIAGEMNQKHINWYPSFSVKHKIPLGTYIAYHEAQKVFDKEFHKVSVSPYLYLEKHPDIKGTYIIYNKNINLGKTSLKHLLKWVKKGNSLLLSSSSFEKELLDSLNLKQNVFVSSFNQNIQLKLLNPALQTKDSIFFDIIFPALSIKSTDSISTPVALGLYLKDKQTDTLNLEHTPYYNFIDVKYGDGHILLHSFPYVFTNYFLLKNHNIDYFEGILSYINRQKPVYWDTGSQNGSTEKGIFKYIIQNPGFLWAYRLLFIGLILYIIFEGKRKQRAIPVITPLKNETLAFTKTIADMYVNQKENQRIGMMHIKHFFDYLRTNLHIDTRLNHKELQERIAQKTKTDLLEVEKLFELIDTIQNNSKISAEVLLDLDKRIQKIKQTAL